MSTEQNKEVVRRFIEGTLNNMNNDLVDVRDSNNSLP